MARLSLSLSLAVAVAVAVLALASGAASQAPVPAPSSSVDCTAAVTGLVSCLPYVQQGSTQGKPTGECCAGVKTAIKSPATVACLCAAFGQYGAQVDLARAAGLPAACGEDPTAFKACNIKVPGAPASAPTAPGTAPAAPSPGSSKSAAVIQSPILAFAVLSVVAATLPSHFLL